MLNSTAEPQGVDREPVEPPRAGGWWPLIAMEKLRRAPIVLSLSTAFVLAATAATAALIIPVEVIGTDGDEGIPSANETWIAWTSNAGHLNRYDAVARPLAGGTRVKLNASGTSGFAGGFDPGTNTVIYQQVDDGRSSLHFFDLDTLQRSPVPGVNTPRWEWSPLVSNHYVIYQRDVRVDGVWWTQLRLHDRTTGIDRLVKRWRKANVFSFSGSIGESTASWTVCGRATVCKAFVGEILPEPPDGFTVRAFEVHPDPSKHQYWPVVDEANDAIYYVRSGNGCGVNVNIFRTPLVLFYDQLGTKVVDLADNVDVALRLSLAPNLTTGMYDLYFDRFRCGRGEGDIYAARGVAPLPA